MRPQDIVAIILAVGVVMMLFSGTNFSTLWMPIEDRIALRESAMEGEGQFWKDILNVILGALAGYIAGRHTDDKRD